MLYINNQTNTRVTVNRIHVALKVTVRCFPAVLSCIVSLIHIGHNTQNQSLGLIFPLMYDLL